MSRRKRSQRQQQADLRRAINEAYQAVRRGTATTFQYALVRELERGAAMVRRNVDLDILYGKNRPGGERDVHPSWCGCTWCDTARRFPARKPGGSP